MADQNRSNRGRMNSMADDIDYSSTLSELERIGARSGRKGINRTELEDRIRGEGKLLNSLLDEGRRTPMIKEGPFYNQQVGQLRESIAGTRARMNGLDSAANSRAESEASTYIARQFSSSAINGQVSGMQREAAVQNRAFGMMGQTYDQIAAQRSDVLADIRVRERGAINEVKGMYSGRGQVDPERSAAIGVMMSGAQSSFRDLAVLNAAQALQKTQGNDPNSKLRRLGEMGGMANSILSAESIAQEVRSGGVNISSGGSMRTVGNDDIQKEVLNQARALSQALKELAEGAGKTDEELAKLRSTADESADNLEKLNKAGGMGGGGGRGNIMSYLGAAGGAFNAAGSAAQSIFVDQRMGQVNNAGGFANLANQQYGMYQKARSGDIASQLALSQFGSADDFGMEMKRGVNVAQTAFMAAGATQVAAGGMQVAEGFKNGATLGFGNSGVGNNLAQGGANVVQGTATMAVTGMDAARGVSAQSARLAGIQAQMQARMAINQVGASQAQGLRDMMTGLDVVGQGMGRGASSFIQNASSDANLANMASARMSPDQFVAAAGQGQEGMGTTFQSSQIFASRNLERGGFGSVGTNLGRMSSLAGAGANNPQAGLESVLSAAVASGLDSSKGINAMVEHTAAMVSSSGASSAAGINTVGASANLLASGMGGGPNREFALSRAAQAVDVAKAITTDTSVSFAGMVNTARVSKSTGLGGTDALFAAQLTTADIKSLQGMDAGAANEALLKKGIDTTGVKGGTAGFLQSMLVNQTSQMFTGSGALAFGDNETRQSLAAKAAGGKGYNDLTTQEKSVVGKIGTTSGLTGEEYFNQARGINAPNTNSTVGADLTAGKGDNDIKKQMDNLRTSGFAQLTEAAASASKDLQKFGGALKVFTDLTAKYEKGGMDNEKEFAGAGGKFAKDFTASLDRFNGATDKYTEASEAMIKAAGLLSNRLPGVPNFAAPLNEKKGSVRGN